MFHYVTIKRRIKVLFSSNGSRRRQQRSMSLSECLDKPAPENNLLKVIITVSLLILTAYYIFFYDAEPPTTLILDTRDSFEISSMEEVKKEIVVTKSLKYSEDSDKIFKVEPHILKAPPESADLLFSRKQGSHGLSDCTRTLTGKVKVYKKVDKPIESEYPMIEVGGCYKPPDCRTRHKIAVLVPYRDREQQLQVFLYNIHPFLMRQKLKYQIFVVEQAGKDIFNKGRLFNAGFLEIQKTGQWPCIVFHDVDLLPTDDRILYSCPDEPRHMCATVIEKENDPVYRLTFGGVTSLMARHYRQVNGYSNKYWGWGGEDNDMFRRLKRAGFSVRRYRKNIARYTTLSHIERPKNPLRYQLLATAAERYKKDGLSNLDYKVISFYSHRLYTQILVDINPKQENITEAMG